AHDDHAWSVICRFDDRSHYRNDHRGGPVCEAKVAPRSNTLRDHYGRSRAVECDTQARIQTTATGAFLRSLTPGDVQFSQWTLTDKRRLLWRARCDPHGAH